VKETFALGDDVAVKPVCVHDRDELSTNSAPAYMLIVLIGSDADGEQYTTPGVVGKALGTVMLYVPFPGTREVRIPVDPTTVPVMGVPLKFMLARSEKE
jgi:hypothetical protein